MQYIFIHFLLLTAHDTARCNVALLDLDQEITELIPDIDPCDPSPRVSVPTYFGHGGGECVQAAQRVPEEPGDGAAGVLPAPRPPGPPVMPRPPGPGHLSGCSQHQNIKVFPT